MELLVKKLGLCTKIGDSFEVCNYHKDRFKVDLFEQPNREGELDLSDDLVSLQPHPVIIDLFQKMQQEIEIAGHWGLMQRHREWLEQKLVNQFANHKTSKPVKILQAGIASHVHYFGTYKIIKEALDKCRYEMNNNGHLQLSTYDRCIGPINVINNLLSILPNYQDLINLEMSNPNLPSELVLSNLVAKLFPNFWKLFLGRSLMDTRVVHQLEVADLTKENALSARKQEFDIVTAHQLFKFWKGEEEELLCTFLNNIYAVTNKNAQLYVGFTPSYNYGNRSLSLERYIQIFNAKGFSLESVTKTWTVYDLDYEQREKFLKLNTSMTFKKEFCLVHLSKK